MFCRLIVLLLQRVEVVLKPLERLLLVKKSFFLLLLLFVLLGCLVLRIEADLPSFPLSRFVLVCARDQELVAVLCRDFVRIVPSIHIGQNEAFKLHTQVLSLLLGLATHVKAVDLLEALRHLVFEGLRHRSHVDLKPACQARVGRTLIHVDV